MAFPKNSPWVKQSCRRDLLDLIRKGKYTAKELGQMLDRETDTISGVLRSLKGHARICEWVYHNGTTQAVWTYGAEPYAVKPRKGELKKPYVSEWKADKIRLVSRYVTGERIWGI